MRRALAILLGIVVILLVGGAAALVLWPQGHPSGRGAEIDRQNFAQIESGRYLTLAADCASCHTLEGQGKPFAGGRPIETPFGNVLAANITPDRETGIGAWSDDEFVEAMRRGRRPDGTRLYPAMPFSYYARMSKDDILAIRAYLDILPPIHNRVVADQLPFPFSVRATMLMWDWLYPTKGAFKPDSTKSAEWNRGAYLVEGAGHCGACHTPKSWLGGDETSRALQGYALQGWFAPDITDDSVRGLGKWSLDEIVNYLKTGHNRVTAATGPMAEEIVLSSENMTDSDLRAIAVFLKDQPGASAPPSPQAPPSAIMDAGGGIYKDACSACHAPDGKGAPNLFPSLADSANVHSADPASLIHVLLQGARSAATPKEPTAPAMPSFAWRLDDAQAAAVLTYVRNSWGSSAPAVSAEEVKSARERLAVRRE